MYSNNRRMQLTYTFESFSEVFSPSFYANSVIWFANRAWVRMIPSRPGFTQYVQHVVSKVKKCQTNRLHLRETVSKWPEADVWERLHTDCDYVKNNGNISLIVDASTILIKTFPAWGRKSEKVKNVTVKPLHDSEYLSLKYLIIVHNL